MFLLVKGCLSEDSHTLVVWNMKAINMVMKYHLLILFVLALGSNCKIKFCTLYTFEIILTSIKCIIFLFNPETQNYWNFDLF